MQRAVLLNAPPAYKQSNIGDLGLYLLVPLQELIDATGGVEELLLSGEIRMAGIADFNFERISG
jgi:hypothetical protein